MVAERPPGDPAVFFNRFDKTVELYFGLLSEDRVSQISSDFSTIADDEEIRLMVADMLIRWLEILLSLGVRSLEESAGHSA